MPVGEAILSAFLQVLFDRLASRDLLDLSRYWKIDAKLNKLNIILLQICALLYDAEEKQIRDMAVKMWLDELKHLAYDAEDILDEFATEALRGKLDEEFQDSINQVWSFIPTFNPTLVFYNVEIASKIEEVTHKLEQMAKLKYDLGLKEGVVRRSTSHGKRLPTTSLVSEVCVFGRDKDKEDIIEFLLRDERDDHKVGVIAIVGMGGIGKTTLAQIVYNDDRVGKHFGLKAWVCVSDEFDVLKITKSILESATKSTYDFNNLEPLQDCLKEKLGGKRFLLVLDDVWNESYNNWDMLRLPFNAGAKGSKIIITTRNDSVASITRTVPCHRLHELSDEDCWLLFSQNAFADTDCEAHQFLEEIGRRIVKKCKGLPLAVKTIGGLLRFNLRSDEWDDILNSKIYDLPDNRSEILSSLILSYYHLPAHLKQCFAYCSIFHKGYMFEKDKLILLWMAEGFIRPPNEKKRMEDVGDEYFRDLVSRSFFQQSDGDKSHFLMHDLIVELAQFVSRNVCCKLEDGKLHKLSNKARHLSYIRGEYDTLKRFDGINEAALLRTFLPLDLPHTAAFCYITRKVPHDLLPELRFLRVLCLSQYAIEFLPDSIGNLKHLRYLDLSQTAIERLPESTSTLYNLQTLILFKCNNLIELPTGMAKLINLRHVDIRGSKLQLMPPAIHRLSSLQTLSDFVVGEESGSGIGELRNISLHGMLSISGLKNVVNIRDAMDANFRDKMYLEALVLEWGGDMNNLRDESVETNVLDMLQPHKNLKKLTIKDYCGSHFPSWIGDPIFTNIVSLVLSSCKNCKSLPALGQLSSLEDLTIEGMEGVKCVGLGFYSNCSSSVKPFQSLKTLRFKEMLQWEEWLSFSVEEGEEFPCLRELFLQGCPKLRGELPKCLPSLSTLEISGCWELTAVPKLPLVSKIVVEECNDTVVKNLTDLSSLTSLRICKISNLQCLPEIVLQQFTALEELEITDCEDLKSLSGEAGLQNLVSLQSLLVENCPQLVSLLVEGRELLLPLRLKYFKLSKCESLEKLPGGLESLTCLETLSIHHCPHLYFPTVGFPPMLKLLYIEECHALESLPKGMMDNSMSFEFLKIEGCSSLTSFPIGKFPSTLKKIEILNCANFMSLPQGMMHNLPSLDTLLINGCPSLTSFPIDGCMLPPSSSSSSITAATKLRKLEIINCENLESLYEVQPDLSNLEELSIRSCPRLISISGGGLPYSNLRLLKISGCKSLESLPGGICHLTRLKKFAIIDCPSLMSVPEGGLPRSLESLQLEGCKNLRNPFELGGLGRLTSLSVFIVGGCPALVSFLDSGLLPTTLTHLHITGLPNLTSLDMALQNLDSLRSLTISECDKLMCLPQKGLPASLSYLTILFCPLLGQRCKQSGKDWLKIAHIPYINIDDQEISIN